MVFFLQLYKNYEEATEAVEKLRLQIYPHLFSTIDSGGGDTNTDDNSPIGLDTITEDMTEQELTEPDTSEAVGESDEDLNNRRKNLHDDYDAINTNDDERDIVRIIVLFILYRNYISKMEIKCHL